MSRLNILIVGLALVVLCEQGAFAIDKIVKCEVTSGNKVEYKGNCIFVPEGGGSFSLSSIHKQKPLYKGITVISVFLIDKGAADVRGLTTNGNNSRWGEAKRSKKDKSCWEGADFKVCAR
jgi:hypothetical protein